MAEFHAVVLIPVRYDTLLNVYWTLSRICATLRNPGEPALSGAPSSVLHLNMQRKGLVLRTYLRVSLIFAFFSATLTSAPLLRAADSNSITILFNAKVFTAEPENPYADAVAIQAGKILAVGNLTEVEKAVGSARAERVDLHGKTLFPGFIDSHSHAIYGGINLISADANEKVRSMDDLVKFVAESKTSGVAQNGDIVEIYSLPLEFWSHTDQLNANFSAGNYKDQPVFLRGMDGHTGWANQALLARAGVNAAFLKTLTAEQRTYYGIAKDGEPNGFLVDAGMEKVTKLIPKLSHARMLAAARAALQYNYKLGITAWLDPLADEIVLKAYKQLADNHELVSEINAFPQVFAKNPAAELAGVRQARESLKNIPNLHITGIKIFADGVVEIPSQTANLTKPYKNTGRNGELLFDPAKFSELCVAADKRIIKGRPFGVGFDCSHQRLQQGAPS